MLQRRKETLPAIPQTVAEGAALHPHDLRPPILVLGQAQSRDRAPGTFTRLDTEESYEELEVVPLRVQPIRTKWPEGEFSRDRRPECWSQDGFVGAPGAAYEGQACSEKCPYFTLRPWEVDPREGWCMPAYGILLMDAGSFDLFILRLHGTSAKLARFFAARGVFQKTIVRLFAEEVSTNKGTWYQLKARAVRPLDEADLALAREQYKAYITVDLNPPEEEEKEAGEEAGEEAEMPPIETPLELPF